MTQKLTIKQIAKIADVSKGTISKILNNRGGIGEDTRQRVLKLIADLEYTPSASARALAFSKSFNIGFIFPNLPDESLSSHYWSSLVASITKEAIANHYNLLLFTPKVDGDLEIIYDRIISAQKVDGMIVAAEFLSSEHKIRLQNAQIPLVLIGQNNDGYNHFIDVDNAKATAQIAQDIIANGFKKIAYIGGPLNTVHTQVRINTFKQVTKEKGCFHSAESLKTYTVKEVQRAVSKVLAKDIAPDSLLIGAGGAMLFDVISALKDKGLDQKLPLWVFDDNPYLDYMFPRVTAIRQPLGEKGKGAVRMLLKIIDNPSIILDPVILEASLVVR